MHHCCYASLRPGKDLPGIQDAVLRTAERILGDENQEDGTIKLPHKCQLRMLLYKHQIGMVMGKKGSTINEMRNKSSATIKLVSPANGVPIVPCALPDDEMVTVSSRSITEAHLHRYRTSMPCSATYLQLFCQVFLAN